LGIIGVVAAITIPNMMSNYRKKLKSTRLKHFYSTLTQSVRMNHGGDSDFDSSMLNEAGNPDEMLEFVKTNYAPYMNLTVLKKSQYGAIVGFPDGSGAEFVRTVVNEKCPAGGNGCTYIVFCPEYKDCDPSPIENFSIKSSYVNNTTRFIFWTDSVPAPNPSVNRVNYIQSCKNGTVEYCTRILHADNWEFKKDYPFKI